MLPGPLPLVCTACCANSLPPRGGLGLQASGMSGVWEETLQARISSSGATCIDVLGLMDEPPASTFPDSGMSGDWEETERARVSSSGATRTISGDANRTMRRLPGVKR
jgi:hypothetical protein